MSVKRATLCTSIQLQTTITSKRRRCGVVRTESGTSTTWPAYVIRYFILHFAGKPHFDAYCDQKIRGHGSPHLQKDTGRWPPRIFIAGHVASAAKIDQNYCVHLTNTRPYKHAARIMRVGDYCVNCRLYAPPPRSQQLPGPASGERRLPHPHHSRRLQPQVHVRRRHALLHRSTLP